MTLENAKHAENLLLCIHRFTFFSERLGSKIGEDGTLTALEKKTIAVVLEALRKRDIEYDPQVDAEIIEGFRDVFTSMRGHLLRHPEKTGIDIKNQIADRLDRPMIKQLFSQLRWAAGSKKSIEEFFDEIDPRWFSREEMTANRGPKQHTSEFLASFGLGTYNYHEKLVREKEGALDWDEVEAILSRQLSIYPQNENTAS